MHLSQEIDQKKIKELLERVDGHQTRLNNDTDLIIELQNEFRNLGDQLKLKAEGEEIDSVHNLVNELYEKVHSLENATGTGSGDSRPPTIQRVGGSGASLGSRGN